MTSFPGGVLACAKSILASPLAVRILVGLLVLDTIFVSVHVYHVYVSNFDRDSIFSDRIFSLEHDGSYSEGFEYLKLLFCVLALAGCYRSTSQPVYAGLSLVYGYVLADNALMLHERAGEAIAPLLGGAERLFATAPQAFAELFFFGVVGMAIAVVLWSAFRRSSFEHRANGGSCLALFLAFAGFGVGLDLLHAALRVSLPIDRLLGLIEDGGELVVLSFTCAVVATFFARMALSYPSSRGR